jgi:hypothetical protein
MSSIRDDNYNIYQNKKIDLDHGHFFVEYFYSIGLNHNTLLDESLYSNILNQSDSNIILEKLNQNLKIKPTIISKYPPINKKNLTIDEDLIIQVCKFTSKI